MNLFFKSYKFYLFFFLTGLLKYAVLLGQEDKTSISLVPETIEFEIPSKYNRTPNTSFCRNDNGVNFIGKEDGHLTIDAGKVFYTPSDAPVYIARTADNSIYYLTENDFGILSYSPTDGPEKVSRKMMLDAYFPGFYPAGILAKDSLVFMATTEGVFVITEKNAGHIFFNRQEVKLFDSGKKVFLQAKNMGLFQWDGDEFFLVATAEALDNKQLAGIIDQDKHILLLRREASPIRVEKATGILSSAQQPGMANQEFLKLQYVFEDLYIGEKATNELVIINTAALYTGSFPSYINLPDTTFNHVFSDRFNDIWIVSDFSIVNMEFPSRSYIMNLNDQLGSFVISSTFHQEDIYLATTGGIYLLKSNHNGSWTPVHIRGENERYFHSIQAKDNLIIAAGLTGTYQVHEGTLKQIINENPDFIKILDDQSIIGSGRTGIFRIVTHQDGWKKQSIDSTIHRIVSYAECDGNRYIMTGKNEIFRLDNSTLHQVHLDIPVSDVLKGMMEYNGGIILLGEQSIYSWDLDSGHCIAIQTSELQKKLLSSDPVFSSNDHLWSVSGDATGGSTIWKLENEFLNTPWYEIMAKRSFGQVLGVDEAGDHLWITGNKMLLRLDTGPEESRPKNMLHIHSATLIADEQDSEPRKIKSSETFRYRKQNIVFALKNIRAPKAPYPYYRYKLNHYQDDWSAWSRNPNIVIENPRERDYIFEAQSVSSYGELSAPVAFEFTVTPPFYRTWFAYVVYIFMLFILSFLLYKWRLLRLKRVENKLEERIREQMKAVLSEKEKSDKLVADLFPRGTAEELKSKGRAKSRKFEMVTVLFSDIQGFTRIAEEMNPEILIDELDQFFYYFDSVVDKYNIEKIKTIGDAYMAAGGIPVKNSSNPVEVVLAGLEMQYYMKDLKKKKADIWDLRMGVHTGPVISGVVGHKKLSYDIWGDTVNTASRMESSGEGGKVNISGITYSLVKDFFICEYRGKLPVKYKGNIDMYFVTGLRAELSVDLQGIPNRRFFVKLQMLKIKDLEERVLELIASNTTMILHFHKNETIQKVCNQAELLGRSENVSDDELLLLQTTAVMMFSGLSETYDHFENTSVEISRKILPDYGYDEKQIDRISNLILASKEPYVPQNILESILIDAKMEYLGRSDYLTQVKLLYLEKKNVYADLSRENFIKQQADLINNYNYFTLAAQRLREVTPKNQLKNLRDWK